MDQSFIVVKLWSTRKNISIVSDRYAGSEFGPTRSSFAFQQTFLLKGLDDQVPLVGREILVLIL